MQYGYQDISLDTQNDTLPEDDGLDYDGDTEYDLFSDHQTFPHIDDWAIRLPNLIPTSEGYKGPCPRYASGGCIADEDGWHVRAGDDGVGVGGCRGCIDGGKDPDRKHFLEMLDIVFPERRQ